MTQISANPPDLILMDIHMPDMDGIEATRIIMSTQPVPIVVLSATVRKRDVDLGLRIHLQFEGIHIDPGRKDYDQIRID